MENVRHSNIGILNRPRIAFMGTSSFAVTILDALMKSNKVQVEAVLTRPDAVSGRGNKKLPSEIKSFAQNLGIENIYTPDNLRDSKIYALIKELDLDLAVVASYGCILPKEILNAPKLGCINVHASLLPRYRGAAPIQRAILDMNKETGVSLMHMEEGLDSGVYCAQAKTEIGNKSLGELTQELALIGASLLLDNLDALIQGSAKWTEQDEGIATYAPKIAKKELFLDPFAPAQINALRVQASSPQSTAKACVCGKSLTVLSAALVSGETHGEILNASEMQEIKSGEVVLFKKRLFLKCDPGFIEVLKVKPDGKKEMDAKSFCAGMHNALKESSGVWSAPK